MRLITSLAAIVLAGLAAYPAAADAPAPYDVGAAPAAVDPEPTGSLWTSGSRSLFADRKARGVGDIVTIVIVQATTTAHKAAHSTSKTIDTEAGPGLGLLSFFPDLSLEADRSTSGTGTSTETTALADRMSARVVAVMPNGTMRIEGTRTVKLKADHLECVVRGLVRQEDVAADNTVLSSEITDLELVWTGRGPINAKQRPGLISRLLDLLW